MPTYKLFVTHTEYTKTVSIDARNEREAKEKVKTLWSVGRIPIQRSDILVSLDWIASRIQIESRIQNTQKVSEEQEFNEGNEEYND